MKLSRVKSGSCCGFTASAEVTARYFCSNLESVQTPPGLAASGEAVWRCDALCTPIRLT